MEQGQELLLKLAREIDEHVSATDQIQFGKRRIHNQVLRRKDHQFPDMFGNTISGLFLDEIALEALPGDIRRNRRQIETLPGTFDSMFVYIGRKYLYPDPSPQL